MITRARLFHRRLKGSYELNIACRFDDIIVDYIARFKVEIER